MTSTEQTQERGQSTGSAEDEAREGQVNSGGESVKGRVGDALSAGAGLVVGAGAYNELPAGRTRNPYYQSGTVETGGYGGPPNINAVTPVFKQARRDAMLLAADIVNDTTGNAAGVGKGVGEGLAPELVNLPMLVGNEAREAGKDKVIAAAAYETAHPVSLSALDDGVVAAGQPADEFGTPLGDQDGDGDDDYSDRSERSGGRVSSRQGSRQGDQGRGGDRDGDGDVDVKDAAHDVADAGTGSSTQPSTEAKAGQQGQAGQTSGSGTPKGRVDPTRSS